MSVIIAFKLLKKFVPYFRQNHKVSRTEKSVFWLEQSSQHSSGQDGSKGWPGVVVSQELHAKGDPSTWFGQARLSTKSLVWSASTLIDKNSVKFLAGTDLENPSKSRPLGYQFQPTMAQIKAEVPVSKLGMFSNLQNPKKHPDFSAKKRRSDPSCFGSFFLGISIFALVL